MLRPIRWYWAVLLSLAAYIAACVLVMVLELGVGGSPPGPLMNPTNWLFRHLKTILGDDLAHGVIALLLATPPALIGLFTYAKLRPASGATDGSLHCLKCGYILKGLSAPRCPECGEPI